MKHLLGTMATGERTIVTFTLLGGAFTALFTFSWHILWMILAVLATLNRIPRRAHQQLTASVERCGGHTARRILRAGSGVIVASASLALPAMAEELPPYDDFLWPEVTVEELSERTSSIAPALETTEHLPATATTLVSAAPAESGSSAPISRPGPEPTEESANTIVAPSPAAEPESSDPLIPVPPVASSQPTPPDTPLFHALLTTHSGLRTGAETFATGPTPYAPSTAKTSGTPHEHHVSDSVPDHYVIQSGDSLWSIASAHSTDRSEPAIDALWRQIYRENAQILGANPDLVYPGIEISLPQSS